jgi:Tol biopolymer transport system component
MDIQGPVAISPRADRMAFVRIALGARTLAEVQVVLAKRDGTEQRVLTSGRMGDAWVNGPVSWSPDGRSIAAAYRSRQDGLLMSAVVIDVANGKLRPLTDPRWNSVSPPVWLHDGTAILFSASDAINMPTQLWMASYPEGQVSRITNDLANYGNGRPELCDSARKPIGA